MQNRPYARKEVAREVEYTEQIVQKAALEAEQLAARDAFGRRF